MLKKLFLSLAVGAASALVFVSCNSTANDVTASSGSAGTVKVLPRLTNAQALDPVDSVYVSLWVDGAAAPVTEKAAYSAGEVTIPAIAKDKNFRLVVAGRTASPDATKWSWLADTTCEAGNASVKIVDMQALTSIPLPSLTSVPPATAIEGTSTTISFTKPADNVTIYYTTDGSAPSATNSKSKSIAASSSTSVTVTTPTVGKASMITVKAVATMEIPGIGTWSTTVIPVALNFDGITSTPSANDSTLSSLTITTSTGATVGALSPAFSKSKLEYTNSTIPASVSKVTVTATATATAANVTYNGGPSGEIDMTGDSATVLIKVTNGEASLTYTLNLKRAAPAFDTSLSALTVNSGTLIPAFGKTIKAYTNTTVSSKVTSVTLAATPTDPAATVTYNGSASGVIDMTNDTATVAIVVTNGTKTNTYTVTLKRAAPTFDTSLSALTVSPGALAPAFLKTTKSYKDTTIPAGTASVTVKATPTDPSATVTYNGETSGVITMTTDTATVAILVTNGTKTNSYSLFLKRMQPARDTTLKSLVLSAGTMKPAFDVKVQTYADTVADSIASLIVTALPKDSSAKVVFGSDTTTKDTVTLVPGLNVVNFKVVNGAKSLNYTVNVFRPSPNDTTVTGLTVTPAGLSALTFVPATKTYMVTYYDTITKVKLKATTKSSKATVTYNGVADSVVNLASVPAGDTLDVPVVATNGGKTNTYTVRFAIKDISSAKAIDVTGTSATIPVSGTGTYTIKYNHTWAWDRVSQQVTMQIGGCNSLSGSILIDGVTATLASNTQYKLPLAWNTLSGSGTITAGTVTIDASSFGTCASFTIDSW